MFFGVRFYCTNSNMNLMNITRSIIFKFLVGFILIILSACSNQSDSKEAQIASIHTQVAQLIHATQTAETKLEKYTQQTAEIRKSLSASPTDQASPTTTDLPTSTLTFTPILTPSETPSPTSTLTPTNIYAGEIPENAIYFYMTLLETGGNIGCGDSLVKLSTGRTKTGDLNTDLKIALDTLFSVGQYAGGTYNATFPSNLRVDQVNLTLDGTANVYLSGSYVKPATSCDASRYRSQVWATALQFKEIVRFIPYVGNSLLGDRLAVYSDGGG